MDAVQGILGTQSNWVAVSNAGMGLNELHEAVAAAVASLEPECEVVVISDMPGGSCHHVCQQLVASGGGLRALTGVNLMMLLEFFVKRERTEINELIQTVKDRGRDAVRIV
jgi:mannose/fructose-specific phosphotransferase system component IIA